MTSVTVVLIFAGMISAQAADGATIPDVPVPDQRGAGLASSSLAAAVRRLNIVKSTRLTVSGNVAVERRRTPILL